MSTSRVRTSWTGGLIVVIALGVLINCGAPLSTRRAHGAVFTPNPKIAILPFDNYTDQDLVSAKITDYFQITMAGHDKFTVVENGTTFEALRRFRVRSATVLRKGQIDSLAQTLQVDYLLAGSVMEYREIGDKFLEKIPQVSINARLIDCKTGATVWTGISNDSGDRTELLFGVGAVKSADDLSRRMVESFVRKIDGLFK